MSSGTSKPDGEQGAVSSTPPATKKSAVDLLKSLSGHVAPASEHFSARQTREGSRPRVTMSDLWPGAETIKSPLGLVSVARSSAPVDGARSRHGHVCPAAGYGSPETWLEGLATIAGDPRWRDLDPSRILFIDTETTSLSGGSGVYALLIGFGWFEGDRFELEQHFMEDFHHEPALIESAAERFGAAQAIVSYNGRGFDMPILETRWRMARRKPSFPELHLDLLGAARRLWKLRLPGCGLGVVEREILGVIRYSDVDGAMIPRLYFDYLRDFHPERFLPVMDHHAQDILSLGALARVVAHAANDPDDPRFAHASEQWGLSMIYDAAGRAGDAERRLERAILAARDEDLGFRLSMRLAKRLARAGRWDEAVEIWLARADQARARRLEPLIELAKHAEHRLKDFEAARRWTERALAVARSHDELRQWLGSAAGKNPAGAEIEEPILKRLERLEKRGTAPRPSRKKQNS